jgi:predicted nuclease with TOPRIM domain
MIPTYGVLSAPIAGVMRDLLLSQPDVVAFDFEATLLPLNPERLGKSPSALPAGAVGESRIELAEIAPYRVSSMDLFPGYSPVIGGQADFKAKDNWVSRLLQLPGATAELDDLRYKAIELGTKLAILKNKLEYIKTDVGTVKEDMDRIKGEYYLAKQTFDDINSIYLRKNKKCPDIEEKICKMRSDISHLKGELGRLEENRRIVKQKMQIPWLRYGLYALVETMRRTSAEVTGTWDGAPASSPPRDRCEDTYYLKDGRLYSENMPLRENYIVLSITPGQLEEDNENLKQASRESRSLLDKLSRSEEEINGVIKDTDDHANNLKLGFIKSHASVVASRVARSVNSKDDFINSMDAARDKYLSESSMCIDEKIVGIFNDVRDGWVSIYDKETSK